MFCSNCGKEINENSAFCQECGTPVSAAETVTESVATVVSEAETPVANLTEVPTKTPVEIPIANTTYNQVPSPDYNSQNVVYAKKPKNKLFAVIACILAMALGVAPIPKPQAAEDITAAS